MYSIQYSLAKTKQKFKLLLNSTVHCQLAIGFLERFSYVGNEYKKCYLYLGATAGAARAELWGVAARVTTYSNKEKIYSTVDKSLF